MSILPENHRIHPETKTCQFDFRLIQAENGSKPKIKHSELFANIPASTDPIPYEWGLYHFTEYQRGWLVARHNLDHSWYLIDASIGVATGRDRPRLRVIAADTKGCDEVAFGIDPRMRREDIEGATIAYRENGKMLFAHSTVEEHHERILLAETAMATVFDELAYGRLSRTLTLVVGNKPSNQQLGALTILEHINSFKHDCMKMARYLEGQLHIGQHVKEPEKYYIYKMVENAFALAKKKWKVEKSAELNQISDHIAPIERRLTSRHSFKRRWEIPTVFPDAQTETESDDS